MKVTFYTEVTETELLFPEVEDSAVVYMGDDINEILLEFRSLDPEPPEVRQKCERCRYETQRTR